MAKEAVLYKEGKKIDFTLTKKVNVGAVVPLGLTMIGIASTSGLSGEIIALEVEGIYEINAKTEDAVAIGDKVYFDHTNRVITTASDSNGDGSGDKFAVAGIATSAKAENVAGTVLVGIEYR